MIWYCDTETIQIKKSFLRKLDLGQYKSYVVKRLFKSKSYIKEIFKEDTDKTLIVLNVFNSGVNENDTIITAKNPIQFYDKLTKITRQSGYKKATVYYHNLKFDMTNILDYFENNNAKYKTVSSLIVGTKWYSYNIIYKGVYIRLLDSFNLTMLKLSDFGKAFGLAQEDQKQEYTFNFDDINTLNEMIRGSVRFENYAIQDVLTLKKGVETFKSMAEVDKITIASTAFANWERTQKKRLVKLTQAEQIDANYTYTGGLCTYNPNFIEKVLDGDFTYIDNNGLYSAASYSTCAGFSHPFPCGMGTYGEGVPDWENPKKYYTIRCRVRAVVKTTTTIPFIRFGKQYNLGIDLSRRYKQNEYVKQFDETFYINSIDLRLLHKYYHVDILEFDYFYEYETVIGIFDEYIDYWIGKKQEAVREGNAGKKTVAKYLVNGLTGKFGQFIEPVETKMEFDENNILMHKHVTMDKPPEMVYMPIVSAILSYSREIFLDMTNSYPKEHFLYCDTDSNILTTEAFNKYVDKNKMDKVALGLWDVEHHIKKIKILRQKTYMFTDFDDKTYIRCAGATPEVKKKITYDNFILGEKIEGATQLKPRLTVGGTALIKQPYILRQVFMS